MLHAPIHTIIPFGSPSTDIEERRDEDELHSTAARATYPGWQLVGFAREGDSRRALRAGGALLARPDPFRADHLLRGLRAGGRYPRTRRGDKGLRRPQVASVG